MDDAFWFDAFPRFLGSVVAILLMAWGLKWLVFRGFFKGRSTRPNWQQWAICLGAILTLVLAGKLGSTTQGSSASLNAPPTEVIVFKPGGCDYSVQFEREPRYYTTKKAMADGNLAPLHGAELAGVGLMRAECAATDAMRYTLPSDLNLAMQQMALDLGLMRPDFAVEEGSLGTVTTITGVKDTERGRITIRVTNYFGPYSVMTLYVASLSSDFQTSEMARFGRSISRH